MPALSVDVAIVGAGMAGSALALGLAESGLRVALLEARVAPPPARGPIQTVEDVDARVSALSPASATWLEQLGAWPRVTAGRIASYRHMHVWDGEGTGAIDFDANEVRAEALGHIVENNQIQHALLSGLTESPVRLLYPAALEQIERRGERLLLSLDQERQVACDLLVGADGANSRVRDWAGLRTRAWDYGQHAVVCSVRTAIPHGDTAWQCFTGQGPLAFLPLAGDGHLCSIVWSTSPEHARTLLSMDADGFHDRLARAFEQRLGEIEASSRRFSFPLRQCHAVDYCQPGIALIGDAAHSIHPLAGQGINLGLLDARVLAEELGRASGRDLNPGDPRVLARYQRRRKGHNLAMMAAMEGFRHLFGAEALPLRWLRNAGLRQVDRAAPLKRLFMEQAMGRQG